MMFLITTLFLLGWLTFPSDCFPGITKPSSTNTTPADPHTPARSPQPTPAAVLAHKRDAAGTITCGVVDGEHGPSPVTCGNTLQTCSVNRNLSLAGCCETTYDDQSSGYVEECEYYDFCTGYYGPKNPFTISVPVPSISVSRFDPPNASFARRSEVPPIQYSLTW